MRKAYEPNWLKLATLFLAALVPLREKLTGAGGLPSVDHVYVSPCSPLLLAPRTLRLGVVPGTGLGLGVGPLTIPGGSVAGPTLTLTLLVTERAPSEMVTVIVYTPFWTNVATVLLPALVPLLASNVGCGAP